MSKPPSLQDVKTEMEEHTEGFPRDIKVIEYFVNPSQGFIQDFRLGGEGGGGRCCVYLATPIFLQPTLLGCTSLHTSHTSH